MKQSTYRVLGFVLDIVDCQFYFSFLIDGVFRWEGHTSQKQWIFCTLCNMSKHSVRKQLCHVWDVTMEVQKPKRSHLSTAETWTHLSFITQSMRKTNLKTLSGKIKTNKQTPNKTTTTSWKVFLTGKDLKCF